MRYKGFVLPGDSYLIVAAAGKIIYYVYQIKMKTPQDLIARIKDKAVKTQGVKDRDGLMRLEKMRRAVNFFLIRICKCSRPCLIRSCILFEQALKCGLDPEFFIGVKPEKERLAGHSWITINRQPFRENEALLQEYTIMMKG